MDDCLALISFMDAMNMFGLKQIYAKSAETKLYQSNNYQFQATTPAVKAHRIPQLKWPSMPENGMKASSLLLAGISLLLTFYDLTFHPTKDVGYGGKNFHWTGIIGLVLSIPSILLYVFSKEYNPWSTAIVASSALFSLSDIFGIFSL